MASCKLLSAKELSVQNFITFKIKILNTSYLKNLICPINSFKTDPLDKKKNSTQGFFDSRKYFKYQRYFRNMYSGCCFISLKFSYFFKILRVSHEILYKKNLPDWEKVGGSKLHVLHVAILSSLFFINF